MNNTVRFSATALVGTGKQGILPKDADGYYTMPVGGLNVYNSMGEYYPYEEAKDLFTGSSSLMRRIKSGCLKGEYGHPKKQPGQSDESFVQRVLTIDEKSTCVHFSDIWLDFNRVKDTSGQPVITIMAKLTPSGPLGPALQKSLDNPKEDVCFSIRAFTEDHYRFGVKNRCLREIVIWDFVTEPGLDGARKYRAPALENYDDQIFTKAQVVSAMGECTEGVAMESTRQAGRSLVQSLGWDFDPKSMPRFLKW
jgi:Peptidase S80 family